MAVLNRTGRRAGLVSLVLLLAAVRLSARQAAPAGPAEIDLPTFVETVDALATALEPGGPDRLTDVLVRMPNRLRVRHGDQHFEVALEPLAQALPGGPDHQAERRRNVQAQLRAMAADARALLDSGSGPPDAKIRETLDSVLARKEFAGRSNEPGTSLRERIQRWLLALLDRLGAGRLGNATTFRVLVWAAVAAAIAVLAYAWSRRSRRAVADVRLRPAAPPVPSRTWAMRSVAAMREGQGTEAVRCAFSAAVARLEEQGVWRVDEARTAREYLNLLPAGEARQPPFGGIAAQFEQVFYGNHGVTAGDLAIVTRHLETLGCLRTSDAPS